MLKLEDLKPGLPLVGLEPASVATVDVGELLGDQVQKIRFVEPCHLRVKIEGFNDIADGWREGLNTGEHVLGDVIMLPHQFFEVQRRGVVKQLPRFPQWEGIDIDAGRLPF